MRSTFGGLEVGLRALRAQQLALEITGHNIANADTPGYSRQVANLTATRPYTIPSFQRPATAGQIGTGVEVAEILRMRDEFVDVQIRKESTNQGQWKARQSNLEQLEVILNEPSDEGIAAHLNKFWKNLQELSFRPEDMAIRSVIQQTGIVFTDMLRHTYSQLQTLQRDIDGQVKIIGGRINSLAQQIAALNDEIGKVTAVGDNPNDLLDKRELLVQELAGLTNISVQTDHLQRYTITISGSLLVSGDHSNSLDFVANPEREGLVDVVWAETGHRVDLRGGELKGLLEMRDEEVAFNMNALNEFAATLIEEFNQVHAAGYGLNGSHNLAFFSGTGAYDIGITIEIMNDLNNIAASIDVGGGAGAPGNGDNAIRLAKVLNNDFLMNNGTATLTDYYETLIVRLGINAEKANTMLENKNALIHHLQNRQESVAGVSLDEEMVNLIKFQNSYSAASRMITAVDEMLQILIANTGIVGR
ncbi:MAG TPA: flagellar hook-associated protein FlgK [Firmicutes bacterium]|jgi:flagellar hook-associated protein 1 FlgK|nr:flagellar hook-associated protein FlgK [Bacillota bacterium]